LVTLLQFDKFELIKLLRNNRHVVLYCTMLARAQTPAERAAIEATMTADDELAPILSELQEGTKHDTAEEERARKAALRKV
jgi:pre-mRNA-splicing helicase BRR2